MKNAIIWAGVIVILSLIAVVSSDVVYEEEIKEDYYQLLVVIGELFNDHAQSEKLYYNRSYPTEKEVANLLSDKVTERGVQKIVGTFFEEHNDIIVYKQRYQEYLNDTLDFSKKQKEANYYHTVRNTILNPALKLIPFDQLIIEQINNQIIVIGEEIEVEFYDANDEQNKYHQYARFGFPPKDIISLSLILIYEGDKNRLDEFEVESHGM